MNSIELSDSVIEALARLVDDGSAEVKREPTHSTLAFHINKANLGAGDPAARQAIGKAKRIRAVLSWSVENAPADGRRFAASLVAVIRGSGGFRSSSPNYVGADAIDDAISALAGEGYVLEPDGSIRALLLDSLSGQDLTKALAAYIRRAKRGALDAALVTGTGKDLLEATAKHVLVTKSGAEPAITNLPTLLAQAFLILDLCIDRKIAKTAQDRFEASLFELGCAVNALWNEEGTGHGRPFPSTLTEHEARAAVEAMGLIAERLLSEL